MSVSHGGLLAVLHYAGLTRLGDVVSNLLNFYGAEDKLANLANNGLYFFKPENP